MNIEEHKNKLILAIQNYIENQQTREILEQITEELLDIQEIKKIDLINNILKEFKTNLIDLSRKELKQRILLLKTLKL